MKPLLRKIFFWNAPAQGDAEMKSFRMRIQAQILRLRRIQMICLPTIVIAFIGLMFTAFLELNGAFRAFFTVFGGFAFLGELYCFFKARGLACPKCRKRIGYLLLDSSYSKNGALLLPKSLPTDIHHCPYCHADWEQGGPGTAKPKKQFLSVILLLIALYGSGCILGPTVNYIYAQCGDEPREICETNEWPCGNISRLTTVLMKEAINGPDDYVLPPALDRALNVFCLVLAYPVSLVSDVITSPYQWWRYCHLPILSNDENGESANE